jgi:uncharacterized membrane protein
MMNIVSMVIAGAATFGVLDFLWLSKVMKETYITGYGRHIDVVNGSIAIHPLAALLFYVLIQFGIVYFAVNGTHDWQTALLRGALLGAFGYGLYNLTLAAVLPDYPWKMVFVDWTWGVVATGVVATVMFYVNSLFA